MTIDEEIARLTAALDARVADLPAHAYAEPIEWQRHSLAAVHARIEHLKQQSAYLGWHDEEARRLVGTARSLLVQVQAQHDDVVGDNLTTEVSTMAARGMAADERRIAHDTRALAWTLRRRRLEQFLPLADAHQRIVANRLYAVRDERQDLRTQIKAIDVGVEIGEL